MDRDREMFNKLRDIPEYENEDLHSHSESGSESSYGSIDADWAGLIEEDGSLVYIESYVSSTVKEKQVHQAIKAASELEKKTFSSPAKSIRHHTKLLNLLRRRPSVRVKNSGGSHIDGPKNNSSNIFTSKGAPDQSPPKVTFRDNPSGEERRVVLKVTEEGNNLGRRASVCEAVIGVIPGRFSEPPDSRIMVAGLVPGSQALKDGTIKIGDWLKEINNVEITWENLDNLLLSLQVPSNAILIVQKCASETLHGDGDHSQKRITQTQLVKFVVGNYERTDEINKFDRSSLPLHAFLYISLAGLTDSSPDRADIKFQFPAVDNKLIQVRGMFITIAHAVQEISDQAVLSSTVMIDGIYYHVAYSKEQKDVFIMILPHTCIVSDDAILLMSQLSNLIKFEFGSLADGLANPANKDYLHRLLSFILEEILLFESDLSAGRLKIEEESLSFDSSYIAPFNSIPRDPNLNFSWFKMGIMFPFPKSLLLKDELAKLQIESCLNELESGDFGESESDCEDCQLQYNIIGSCIYYKGYLLSSHLDCDSTQDIWLYVHHHRYLMLIGREAVSQLVVWRSVFPRDYQNSIPNGRDICQYLLVVAMNHFLLALLVESGNVTELLDEKAGPDPFLVDQAETTLYHLHSLYIHSACEESISSGGIETVTLDKKVGSLSPQKKNRTNESSQDSPEATINRPPDVPSILKQEKSLVQFPDLRVEDNSSGCHCDGENSNAGGESFVPPLGNFEEEEDDEPDEVDGTKDENSSDSDWRIWKGFDRSFSYPGEDRLAAFKGDGPGPLRLTIGKTNVLFHIVHLEVGEGILVMPHCSSFTLSSAPPQFCLHNHLLQNFYTTCSHLRQILQTGHKNKPSSDSYSSSKELNNVREYGIMFSCSEGLTVNANKKKMQDIFYWIVGRIYGSPYNREIYVCYDDSIPQNIQEIAFRIGLGCS